MENYKKVEFIREKIGLFENPIEGEYEESTKKRLGIFLELEDDLQEVNDIKVVKKIALIINEETGKIEKIATENITFLK